MAGSPVATNTHCQPASPSRPSSDSSSPPASEPSMFASALPSVKRPSTRVRWLCGNHSVR
ncbi:major facilitator superfamily MFS_1 [Burkholderia mallei NCTC 10247]|nr:major facilitator superfamily MFS_1 [Burkholderia mallei]AIS27239.1 major facilitator superfamily MFS_1 [Burkholderia mallei NCTC 10247]KGD20689.1 major facilitator superfamily MFS_1 [Burkholderia pseudomallei]AIO56369.1 major facilitator superfamily MFS_1 [Burkholderia mallei]AIO60818.1 major facilitator superfamily MFS_1 [Burkholderia mallei]